MDKKITDTKFMTKGELCTLFRISPTTLRHYMNHRYIKELTALGYNAKQRTIQPAVYNWLIEKLAYTPDELNFN